MNKKMI
jgi:hypothetical protein